MRTPFRGEVPWFLEESMASSAIPNSCEDSESATTLLAAAMRRCRCRIMFHIDRPWLPATGSLLGTTWALSSARTQLTIVVFSNVL